MSQDKTGVFVCATCGKEYRMCRKCQHTKIPYVAWRATACSPECYSVSETINAHFYGRIDSAEAAKRFADAGWKNIEHILPEVEAYIKDVIKSSKRAAKTDGELENKVEKDDK